FEVAVLTGPDPSSEDWASVGKVESRALSITFSGQPESDPPHLSDFCLDPFLRLSGFYHLTIERGDHSEEEVYESPWVIQPCPEEGDSVELTLPLERQRQQRDGGGIL